jgi:hypothetical protein
MPPSVIVAGECNLLWVATDVKRKNALYLLAWRRHILTLAPNNTLTPWGAMLRD